MRPGQTGLHLQRGEQGVLPCSPRLNWYGGIPLRQKCSEDKDEVYTAVNLRSQFFPDRKLFHFPDFKYRLLFFTLY